MGVTKLKRKEKRNRAKSNNRVARIKQLMERPTIKNVDIEAIKQEFAAKLAPVAETAPAAPAKPAKKAPKAEVDKPVAPITEPTPAEETAPIAEAPAADAPVATDEKPVE